MQIYVARHGQTDWNAQHKAQGRSVDLPLNATGVKQAQALRDQVKTIKFDAIFSSTSSVNIVTRPTFSSLNTVQSPKLLIGF